MNSLALTSLPRISADPYQGRTILLLLRLPRPVSTSSSLERCQIIPLLRSGLSLLSAADGSTGSLTRTGPTRFDLRVLGKPARVLIGERVAMAGWTLAAMGDSRAGRRDNGPSEKEDKLCSMRRQRTFFRICSFLEDAAPNCLQRLCLRSPTAFLKLWSWMRYVTISGRNVAQAEQDHSAWCASRHYICPRKLDSGAEHSRMTIPWYDPS